MPRVELFRWPQRDVTWQRAKGRENIHLHLFTNRSLHPPSAGLMTLGPSMCRNIIFFWYPTQMIQLVVEGWKKGGRYLNGVSGSKSRVMVVVVVVIAVVVMMGVLVLVLVRVVVVVEVMVLERDGGYYDGDVGGDGCGACGSDTIGGGGSCYGDGVLLLVMVLVLMVMWWRHPYVCICACTVENCLIFDQNTFGNASVISFGFLFSVASSITSPCFESWKPVLSPFTRTCSLPPVESPCTISHKHLSFPFSRCHEYSHLNNSPVCTAPRPPICH